MKDPSDTIAELREALNECKKHYKELDSQWRYLDEGRINSFRIALDMPDATIPQMIGRIVELRRIVSMPASVN